MTDTKKSLQIEREEVFDRSIEIARGLAGLPEHTGNPVVDELNYQAKAEMARHRNALEGVVAIIDKRLQLIEAIAEAEGSLQEPSAVE